METTTGPTLARTDHTGAAPPVLALHGLASNRRWWRLVAERSRHRVIAVDLRGHGESFAPDTGYGFAAVAADVVALADELGLQRFAVAGHSWGASVALVVAAGQPERVVSVICVDGGLGDLRARFPGGWAEAAVAMRPPDLVGVHRAEVAGWATGTLAEGSSPAAVLDMLLGNFEPADPAAGAADVAGARLRPRLRLERHMEIARELFELDQAALLRRVTAPVTAILARESGGGPWQRDREEGALRAADILGPRLRVVWVDGGHDLPVQRPDAVAAALDEAVVAG